MSSRDGKVLEETPSPALKPPVIASALAAPGSSPSPGPDGRTPLVMPSYPPADDQEQVLDPRVAFVMTHLMKEVVNYGTGYGAKSLERNAAGKTGTTNDFLDAWFMGFTPHLVTGVWIGYDDLKSLGQGETGAHAALPVWVGFMKEAVKNYPVEDFTIPPGVVFASIDPNTGKLLDPNSPKAIQEAFIEGTQPQGAVGHDTESDNQGEFLKEDFQ